MSSDRSAPGSVRPCSKLRRPTGTRFGSSIATIRFPTTPKPSRPPRPRFAPTNRESSGSITIASSRTRALFPPRPTVRSPPTFSSIRAHSASASLPGSSAKRSRRTTGRVSRWVSPGRRRSSSTAGSFRGRSRSKLSRQSSKTRSVTRFWCKKGDKGTGGDREIKSELGFDSSPHLLLSPPPPSYTRTERGALPTRPLFFPTVCGRIGVSWNSTID
jgi:hypothetical protein